MPSGKTCVPLVPVCITGGTRPKRLCAKACTGVCQSQRGKQAKEK